MFGSGGAGGEFDGPDLFQSRGLARYRSAPSSFMAALLDSNAADNSSSGDDESDAFFSALIEEKGGYSMKQEVGPAEAEARPGYAGSCSLEMDDGGNGNVSCLNLLRQSSSPAGFFNGFGAMGEANHHMSFSSSSSSRFMPTIPENINESITTTGGFEFENQNGESRKRSKSLVSHTSLPKTSAEMENYLNFGQEMNGVPCQIRAKRGFATHPRSIAERIRRTRISGNMKKLQDLFPNIDKQTNTADMLEMAVEYIKDLQNQVQVIEAINK